MRRVLVVFLIAACGGDEKQAPPAMADAAIALPEVEPPEPLPALPDFPEGTRSLRLVKTVGVRLEPGEEAKRIGTIAQDTRVAWRRTDPARGCKKPWVEIEPRGWVCGDFLEASTRAPNGSEMPRLDRAEVVPGTYGRVVEEGALVYRLAEDIMVQDRPLLGSVTVRKYGEVTVGAKTYWKISRAGEYVLAKSIREHEPSGYQGVRLGDDTGLTLPLAFLWPRQNGVTKVWIRRNAKGQGALRQVAQRTPYPILEVAEEAGKPRAYRIGEGEWVMADQVRIAERAEPPPEVGEHERWFDIDLDTQIVVAYEGTLPVYATMVSSGKKDTPTPTGIWRMWKKAAEFDMKGLSGEDPYSVATVPWTQFYDPNEGVALHASYWHDRFGVPRSHGCVNLSPIDARWLYFWSEPVPPPGWTMTAGVFELPGSIVRVRSKADPSPELKGYAKRVQESRVGSGDDG